MSTTLLSSLFLIYETAMILLTCGDSIFLPIERSMIGPVDLLESKLFLAMSGDPSRLLSWWYRPWAFIIVRTLVWRDSGTSSAGFTSDPVTFIVLYYSRLLAMFLMPSFVYALLPTLAVESLLSQKFVSVVMKLCLCCTIELNIYLRNFCAATSLG